MFLRDINLRPLKPADIPTLEEWREQFTDATLDVPKGYQRKGVETIIAERNFVPFASLTGRSVVLVDPLLHDPKVTGPELYNAIIMLERALTLKAQNGGAVDAFVAIPNTLAHYQHIVEKSGYIYASDGVKVYRRPLEKDQVVESQEVKKEL